MFWRHSAWKSFNNEYDSMIELTPKSCCPTFGGQFRFTLLLNQTIVHPGLAKH